MNFGYTKLACSWSGIQLEDLIHLAVGELYLNRLRESTSGQMRRQQNISGLYSSFAQLMDQDLFLFYFQPIITKVESGEIDASLLAVEILLLGNEHSPFVVTGGNIHLAQDSDHTPFSPAGTPLCFANPSKDHYEAAFRDGGEEWTYKADRNENGYLGVWILL